MARDRGGLGDSSAVDTERLSGKGEEAATARLEVTVSLNTLVVAAGEVGGASGGGDGASVKASGAAEVLAEASGVTLAARGTGTSSRAGCTLNANGVAPCESGVAEEVTVGRTVIGDRVGRVCAAGGRGLVTKLIVLARLACVEWLLTMGKARAARTLTTVSMVPPRIRMRALRRTALLESERLALILAMD